jgi:hypothetical protein
MATDDGRRLIHLRRANAPDLFEIRPALDAYRVGDRVEVRMPDGQWLPGFVDERKLSGPIAITLRTG